MKQKIIGIVVYMLLIITLFPISVMAGDETDPEISDAAGDALANVDIQKVWFFENPTTPEYLYITIKVTDLDTMYTGTLLNDVYWTMKHVPHYAYAGVGMYLSEILGKTDFAVGIVKIPISSEINGSLNVQNRTITYLIPKFLIGNPQKGDILIKTHAGTSQRTPFMEKLGWDAYVITWFYRHLGSPSSGWIDHAPDNGYGREYTIQY